MNRKFSEEQRKAAVSLVEQRRLANPKDRTVYREIAEQCGVGEQSLRLWVRSRDAELRQAAADVSQDGIRTEQDIVNELEQLRTKIQKLQAENEVLKRAFVVFSADWAK